MKQSAKFNFKIITALALITNIRISGQETASAFEFYPAGIVMEYGLGNYAIKDKYISEEKYSGTLPYFSVG